MRFNSGRFLSRLLLSIVFPSSIEEMRAGQASFIESAPLPEDQKQQQIAALEGVTAVSQAMSGLLGTFFTSAIVAAIVAAFQRRK